jgi:hypothetical protein
MFLRVVRVVRAEHGAFGGGGRLGVVYRVDEEREAESVGEEDEFLRSQEQYQPLISCQLSIL